VSPPNPLKSEDAAFRWVLYVLAACVCFAVVVLLIRAVF
jgi:hypothetical protein